FVFARDGAEALARLRDDPAVEVVLTDINMPGMDGLTLLGRIQESNRLLRPVIVSAYGDLPNIRTAMNRGASDFLTKPIDFYDFFLVDGDRLGLAIGDVSGKGMSAALFMTVSRTVLRTVALQGAPPGECLREVNRCLARDNQSSLFVTAFYAVLDLRTGEL